MYISFITNNKFLKLFFKHNLSSSDQSFAYYPMSIFVHLNYIGFIPTLPKHKLPRGASIDICHVMSLFYFVAVEIFELFILYQKAIFFLPIKNLTCASNPKNFNFSNYEVDKNSLRRVLLVTPNK